MPTLTLVDQPTADSDLDLEAFDSWSVATATPVDLCVGWCLVDTGRRDLPLAA